MTGYIYRAVNKVNGKVYIGFTIRTLECRIKAHCYTALAGSKCVFHRALKRYGVDGFDWSIIYVSKDEDHCLNTMEPYFITEYSAIGKLGYNVALGGNRGPRLSGSENGMYGRTHTVDARKKISGRKNTTKNRTYEELFGVEKAKQLRQSRSNALKQHCRIDPHTGANNPNFDSTVYNFANDDGQIFTGTMYDFRQFDAMVSKGDTHKIKRFGKRRGWQRVR